MVPTVHAQKHGTSPQVPEMSTSQILTVEFEDPDAMQLPSVQSEVNALSCALALEVAFHCKNY